MKEEEKNPVGNPIPPNIPETEAGQEMKDAQEEAAASKPSNRDLYMQEYGKRYPDLGGDEEAMYGKAMENLGRMDSYEKGNQAISDAIGNNNALAGLLVAASHGEDPWMWMAENVGADLSELANDPAYAKKISDAIGKFNKAQEEAAKVSEERQNNVQESLKTMQGYQEEKGLSDEDALKLWSEITEAASRINNEGILTKDDIVRFTKGGTYDADVEQARQEGAVSGRNEKISEQLKKANQNNGMPPSLGGTSSRPRVKREEKKQSDWGGLD